MPAPNVDTRRFTNPIIDRDVPDPDAIALPDGGYALVASSFDRAPGLPLWHSDDLVAWTPVGWAGGYREDAAHDGGVWAPSIRAHDGRLYITWGDPDVGVFVVDAETLDGPWSTPRLVRAGRGLIDACPIWDEDGRAHIVHGYARSRAGFANRIDAFEVDPRLTAAMGESRVLLDGDAIPGCTVLEGPKAYRRDGELWIFAPAGGVATGWQYVFRAPGWDGPWQHRTVLAQGSTETNGPHQGAWVEGAGGEDWFLHFQHKDHLGRVLHLQPVRWNDDGWPEIGQPGADGVGEPVADWALPAGARVVVAEAQGDEFAGSTVSPVWHGRPASPEAIVAAVGGGSIELRGDSGDLLRPLDGATTAIEVTVQASRDAAAALVLVDAETAELRAHGDGRRRFVAGDGTETDLPMTGGLLGLRFEGANAWFTVDGADVAGPLPLTGRRWTGTEWGLAARGPGSASFGPVVAR
jgi:beta-xylosidase